MRHLNLLTKGNSKLDKSVLCWSITPVKSCLNCNDCKDTCYARKPYNRYPNVKKAWDRNYKMAQSGEFVDHIIKQYENMNHKKITSYTRLVYGKRGLTLRIHVSGDFFSQSYVDNWAMLSMRINKIYPINIYTYTKVLDRFDFSELSQYCNVINSITPIGINYGNESHCLKLRKLGYMICPATQCHEDIICGGGQIKSCNLCISRSKVAFIKH